ncbi:sigma factor [Roseateles sp.]|uniref:sigma factor n=1 Tax=Roseateles sp. TaxID=1971397 RepID=UPI00359F9749
MSSSPAWPLDPAAVGGDVGDDGERDAAGELLEPLAADDDAAAPDASTPSAVPSAATASLTDEELALLVARVMDQDERALAVLYEQLSGQVYALCLRITGEVGRAEEVLEDVFWQVWRQAPRFCASRGNVAGLGDDDGALARHRCRPQPPPRPRVLGQPRAQRARRGAGQ